MLFLYQHCVKLLCVMWKGLLVVINPQIEPKVARKSINAALMSPQYNNNFPNWHQDTHVKTRNEYPSHCLRKTNISGIALEKSLEFFHLH